ncbi:MAG: hypothetical protein EBX81_00710 [bacterium]|jgi:hypothetical protein|nr:hypothetical protein [Candidatus Aquidulcis sp.]
MRTSYLLVREDRDRSFYALMSDAEPTRLLSSIALPAGAKISAVEQLLQSMAGVDAKARISTTLRGDPDVLGRAASRCAEAFGIPIVILDIAHDAGRVAWATPTAVGELLSAPEAALIPGDAAERRRRCDAVLRSLGELDRAEIADRLGDIADRPMSGRDDLGDQIRAAACADALRALAEHWDEAGASPNGAAFIATGQLAAYLASGAVQLAALAPLVPLGRTTILLDRSGVIAAIGTGQLDETTGAELARATAEQLLLPAGDLLVVVDNPDAEVLVHAGGDEHALQVDDVLAFELAAGEYADIEVVMDGRAVSAELCGGLLGIAIVRGVPFIGVVDVPRTARPSQVLPMAAPLEILPRSASALGGLGGRLLLGDEVAGSLYFSATEPDSRGWAAAQKAGILALVSVSPETVLRARAVGIRGVVVGSLSDGEREALSASIDRRVAAGVAPSPFGLLILGGRRESDEWAGEVGKALASLHECEVRLERHPAGLITTSDRVASERLAADTVVIGGARAGSYGTWRGLADALSSDPLGAVEINGDLVVLPLGDLQRLTA